MQHVALICPHLGDGGVQRVVCLLAKGWAERGAEVTVVALYRDEVQYALDPRVRFVSLPDWEHAGRWIRFVEEKRLQVDRLKARRRSARVATFGQPADPSTRSSKGKVSIRNGQRGLVGSGLVRALKNPALRGLWRLHIPIYMRVRELRRVLDSIGADAIVSFCGSTNVTSVLACAADARRLVISERNDPRRQRLASPWDGLREVYYDDADVVTANTRGALLTLEAYVEGHRLAYVPNPVPTPPPPPPGTRRRGTELLVVGRLHPQKAHAVLLDAVARLPAQLDAWRLTVLGQGELEDELRARARRLGIAHRVTWCGQLEDPYPHYHAADIFVLPSLHEGSPNALMEAMSCGLACIVTDGSPGPLELVEDGKSGVVVPVGDAGALADAIERLARSLELRERLGDGARRRVEGRDLDGILDTWERLLRGDRDAPGARELA